MSTIVCLCLLLVFLAYSRAIAGPGPFSIRINCGEEKEFYDPETETHWSKDIGFSGGDISSALHPGYMDPTMKTARFFPLSFGPTGCYKFSGVPFGQYVARVYLAVLPGDSEPSSFDISVEGTQVISVKSDWIVHFHETIVEAILNLHEETASICFHNIGYGDPAVSAIEILQLHDVAYYGGQLGGEGIILRTVARINCGATTMIRDEDRIGNRIWFPIPFFNPVLDHKRAVKTSINQPSEKPLYPISLYQSAIISSKDKPYMEYSIIVGIGRKYSIWLHFSEVEKQVGVGQRIFDIFINGKLTFEAVDVIRQSGGRYTPLILNATLVAFRKTLTITLLPRNGTSAIISAIEIFQIVRVESKTVPAEVTALHTLMGSLGIPPQLGWSGDPCVPPQHRWNGSTCKFDSTTNQWVIDKLRLGNLGLKGFVSNDIANLQHLRSMKTKEERKKKTKSRVQ